MKKSRREDTLRPVQKIEVPEKHVALRVVFFVLAIVVAIGAFAYALSAMLTVSNGWQLIEAEASEVSVAPELSFYYYISATKGREAKAEKTAVAGDYADACVNIYKIFDAFTDNVNNLGVINAKPNQTVTVNAVLYKALQKVCAYDSKLLFLAPIYERRANVFFAMDDFSAQLFDPDYNSSEQQFYNDILGFVNNGTAVSLDLLEGNSVRLNVSNDYYQYATQNGVTTYVDFFYLKNAFVVDYVVDYLAEKGYKTGVISSIDGFTRTLSADMAENTITLFDNVNGLPYACANVVLKQSLSAVNLHSFQIRTNEYYYYKYSNGTIVTPFVSADGLDNVSLSFLFGYSQNSSCSDVLINILPLFMSGTTDGQLFVALLDTGINTVFVCDKTVYYTQSNLDIAVRQTEEGNTYQKQLLSD